MSNEYIQQIAYNTRTKTGFDITMSGKSTTLTNDFSPEINLQGNWGVALMNISTYNTIANVTPNNNKFKYFNGKVWILLTIGVGSYELTDLSDEVIRLMKINTDYDTANDKPYLWFEPNLSRLTTELYLENGYKVDFNIPNGIGNILGFKKTVVDKNYNESPNSINIINVNSILAHCDLVQSSYYNGKPSNIIYSFPINSDPGYRMISEPLVQRMHKIIPEKISKIRVWLTDDNNNPLDLRKELVTINLRFQEM